jgi:proteasome alpha subunit
MSSPFYVSPEQWFLEKADYARKGIARGKSLVALEYENGIVLVAENSSATLRKTAEIYDRIAFAGVGKLDEYESLRKSGVRYADLKGYTFCREDVSAKSLADEYSTVLGNIFTREAKAYEVEILIAEVGNSRASSFYQILYDGFIADHTHFAAIGGVAEELRETLRADWKESMSLADAVRLACRALSKAPTGSQKLDESNLEVSILERSRVGRKFRRLSENEIRELVSG